jgi:hypothetical protein
VCTFLESKKLQSQIGDDLASTYVQDDQQLIEKMRLKDIEVAINQYEVTTLSPNGNSSVDNNAKCCYLGVFRPSVCCYVDDVSNTDHNLNIVSSLLMMQSGTVESPR